MSYRLPTTELILPHSFDDIKFPVNRISDNITFNRKLELLEDNFKKLLEHCDVVDNNLPTTYDYNFYKDGDSLKYNISTTGIDPSNHNYSHIEIIERYDGDVVIICATNDTIDFYKGDINTPNNLSLMFSYTQIKDAGSLSFKNIAYMKIYDEKLYIYDSNLESMIVYNILPIITDDVAILNVKFLKQFFKIRGLIAFDFIPNKICAVSSDKLFIFNKDFNIISQYDVSPNPIDIIFNGDNFQVLYNDHIKLYDSSTGEFIKQTDLILLGQSTETILNFKKSKIDDTYYVLSDKYIYKYIIDGTFVGYFKINTMGGKNFTNFCISDHPDCDFIFGLDENKIHFFRNKLVTFKLYDEVNLLDKSDISDHYIQNLELEQDFVYNAVLQKTLFNTFLLYNSLIFKSFIETDDNGVLVFKHLENLVNTVVLEQNNIFYGQNEVFSFQTFNRAFEEIYSIQKKILKLIEFGVIENSTNTLLI